MSASRSKLPVNVVNLPYRSLVVQKTLTYNKFRYPNGPHKVHIEGEVDRDWDSIKIDVKNIRVMK